MKENIPHQANWWFHVGLELANHSLCYPHLPENLESYAKTAELQKCFRLAANLFGRAQIRRQRFGIVMPPVGLDVGTSLSRVREALGEAFQSAWSEGEQLTIKEAIGCALQVL